MAGSTRDGDRTAAMAAPRLFADPEFPAGPASLFGHNRHRDVGGGCGCDADGSLRSLRRAQWRRPHELCDAPLLLPSSNNPGQDGPWGVAQGGDRQRVPAAMPLQGAVGDCWLLSASVALLRNPHLMDTVFPAGQVLRPGESGYTGRVRVRLWQPHLAAAGGWLEVVVDDLLPTLPSPRRLCFASCSCPRVFWVPLLEKAFAKLHGCYGSLHSGQVPDALVSLSGGVAEKWFTPRHHRHNRNNHNRPLQQQNQNQNHDRRQQDDCHHHRHQQQKEEEEDQKCHHHHQQDHDQLQQKKELQKHHQHHRDGDAGDGRDDDGDVADGGGGRAVRRALPSDWFERLRRLADGGWITCAVHHGSRAATGGFHAFSVLGTSETRGHGDTKTPGERSLLLWNTWGRHGLGAPGAGVEPGAEPGELWVTEAQFPDLFDEVTVGYPIMPSGALLDIHSGRLLPHLSCREGRWVAGVSAGGSRNGPRFVTNPGYLVTVASPGGVLLVALSQLLPGGDAAEEEEEQAGKGSGRDGGMVTLEAIGVHVWKDTGGRDPPAWEPPVLSTPHHEYSRHVHTATTTAARGDNGSTSGGGGGGARGGAVWLPPGVYRAVASTFRAGAPGRFLLRVFSSSRVTIRLATPTEGERRSSSPRQQRRRVQAAEQLGQAVVELSRVSVMGP